LEIGVGSGRFAQALGIKTGIDPSSKMLEIAKKRGITVFQTRGEERFFNKNIFGTVFLILTLCFVDLPSMVLREVHRILKPDGKMVIGIILKDSPWGRYYQRKKEEGHYFYKHAIFHSYQEIQQILEDSGFTIERVISTLFQKPGQVKEMEVPREGYLADAGFNVITAGKILF
jgi:SAM-dependent methyltransferase